MYAHNPNPAAWSILTLWREGFDTFDIAEMLGITEADVANRLIYLREKARARHG